ncbi:MAG: IclR family transcriptional regulator [Nocardioidaceae bacterium]
MAEPRTPESGRVQAVDRAMALLNAISAAAPAGRPVAELAAEVDLNRATAWRLLATLEHHSMVERDPVSNRYSVGLGIARLAVSAGTAGLVRRAHPVLERICSETGETANLAVPQRLGLAYVDEVTPPAVLAARWLGSQAPMHATSAGKAFLAWLPDDEVASILSVPLAEYTETTRTDRTALREELAHIHRTGYAVSDGELESGVNGVSAPVLDDELVPIAVVSLWGPSARVPRGRFAEVGAVVVAAAAEI